MRAPANDNPNYMIPDYFENPVIRPYLRNVRDWQGYIRFLARISHQGSIDLNFLPPTESYILRTV